MTLDHEFKLRIGHRAYFKNNNNSNTYVLLFQKLLCEKLEEQLQDLDVALKKKERAERRYCEMCVNVLLGNLVAKLSSSTG